MTMTNDSEKITIDITIGGEKVLLTIPEKRRGAVKDIEAEVTALYNLWKRQFTNKTDRELLAMMAYQYASFYLELREAVHSATLLAEDCLLKVETIVDASPLVNDA